MFELLNLPDVVVEKILSYLNYDDIARYRIVCRQFDTLGKQLLNKGFILVEKYHEHCFMALKSQLPRRESERRNHPLAQHYNILKSIESRLSLLAMTFIKYIDAGLCCFIPGKVIDEIFQVLHKLKNSEVPPRANEFLQELRDISCMAMEHFDEKIVPLLKHSLASSAADSSYSMTVGHDYPRLEFSKIHSRTKENKESVGSLKRIIGNLTLKLKRYGAQLTMQSAKICQQEAKLSEQVTKLTEQDTQIAELKRHLEEWDHKFGDLAAELRRACEESGAIAEAGTSHSVEGRIARKMLPVGSVMAEGQVSRRKVKTATIVSIDVTDPGQGKDRDRSCKKKRKAAPNSSKVDAVKKRKVHPSNKVSK